MTDEQPGLPIGGPIFPSSPPPFLSLPPFFFFSPLPGRGRWREKSDEAKGRGHAAGQSMPTPAAGSLPSPPLFPSSLSPSFFSKRRVEIEDRPPE